MDRMRHSKLSFWLSLSLVGATTACLDVTGNPDEVLAEHTDEIVGGTATTISAVPWQCAVLTQSGFQFCGCSIVNSRWVLTAQHCVASGSSDMVVLAGVSNISQRANGQLRPVNAVMKAPGFGDPTTGHDVSLLQVNPPLDLSGANAKAIPLVTTDDVAAGATNPGVISTVTGWGTTSEGAATTSDVLRTVDVPIVSNAQATQLYGLTITADQLAAGLVGQGGKDSCQGDSGGPLTVSVNGVRKLAGVVSWGNGCARAQFPGLYARVSSFVTYIWNQMASAVSEPILLANLSGARNSFTHRTVTVPAGTRTLSVILRGGTGDADLYVRFGSQPTTAAFNCRPFLNGNNEFCSIDSPAAGTWFVSLQGFAAYSGATLDVILYTTP